MMPKWAVGVIVKRAGGNLQNMYRKCYELCRLLKTWLGHYTN